MDNNLHPTMAAALAPFAPMSQGIYRRSHPVAPRAPKGQIEYEWNTDCSAPVVCHLDSEREQKQTEIDPSIPASVTLTAAYILNVNIFDLLSDEQKEEIEELALNDMQGD